MFRSCDLLLLSQTGFIIPGKRYPLAVDGETSSRKVHCKLYLFVVVGISFSLILCLGSDAVRSRNILLFAPPISLVLPGSHLRASEGLIARNHRTLKTISVIAPDLAVPRMGSRMIVYYCPGLAFVRCHSDPLVCLMIPMLFGNMTVSNG